MQSVQKESGWPIWPLFAAIPVVLALGFVAGMAIAAYRPGSAPAVRTPAPDQAAAAPNLSLPGDSSWMIPTPSNPANDVGSSSIGPARPPSLPQTTTATPVNVYFRGPAANIDDARLALLTDFGIYRLGNEAISIDYEKMRQESGSVSLVGLISVRDYDVWSRALASQPDSLKRWLERAAARVQSAAAKEGFHLAWAVVDVTRDKPAGFTDDEAQPLDNRAFLIIRPLASTVDHTKTDVSLRPAGTPAQAGPAGASPWAVYGPVIRFDDTDLYRPARAMSSRPMQR